MYFPLLQILRVRLYLEMIGVPTPSQSIGLDRRTRRVYYTCIKRRVYIFCICRTDLFMMHVFIGPTERCHLGSDSHFCNCCSMHWARQEGTCIFIVTAIRSKAQGPISCPSISLLNTRESHSDRMMHSSTRQDLTPS